MKAFILYFSFTVFLAVSCNQHTTGKKIQTFTWLIGAWEMKNADGIIFESWEAANDSVMLGKSDFVKGDSIIPFETIRLIKRGKDFFYEAKAAGQNNDQPVEFQLSSFSDAGFVAENPTHDFPKRITYKLIHNDSIHAVVDGGPQMPEKKSNFYYSRKKV